MKSFGGALGRLNLANTEVASGLWSSQEQFLFKTARLWPSAGYYVVQTFLASGSWTAPTGVTSVDYLVVAGGGGGGCAAGGGGGAGGFRIGTGISVSAGNTYTITVGAGAATQTNQNNTTSFQKIQ